MKDQKRRDNERSMKGLKRRDNERSKKKGQCKI